jgi:hypothetical protein
MRCYFERAVTSEELWQLADITYEWKRVSK